MESLTHKNKSFLLKNIHYSIIASPTELLVSGKTLYLKKMSFYLTI